ncbi:Molybdopterin biosynthesis MoaE [Pelagophyceae sp. CCMP2097]|nr:Molybdopterin biosynthesis MoaE [Pelagophyceae sp. CCMP2097]
MARDGGAIGAAADLAADLVLISEAPLSHETAVAFVTRDSCGAIATFLGITRDNFGGKRVSQLSYEAYEPMALKEMGRICATARARWGIERAAVLHRIGDVPVGGASVIIAMASPHRKDALDACAWAIDELKAKVPIWKKEVYVEGNPTWKENAEWAAPTRAANDPASSAAETGPASS